jgi:hypothetical protein
LEDIEEVAEVTIVISELEPVLVVRNYDVLQVVIIF